MHRLPIIFVYGPTAVGKTEFVEKLAQQIPSEIVNMDSAQCYTDLKIGTAKPNWQSSPTPHHLFDTLDSPIYSSVTDYREQAIKVINAIWEKGKIPIFVGGSGFYLMSLLYPPMSDPTNTVLNRGTWEDLFAIDPERAKEIHKNDQYRIDRALAIWQETGTKPSHFVPDFNPPGDFKLFFLTRDRQELRDRIQQRTSTMLKEGFVEEVQLLGKEWRDFLNRKKIIGYSEVFAYLDTKQTAADYKRMSESIVNKTAGYAKRQNIFWRMLEGKLKATKKTNNKVFVNFETHVINLTLSGLDLYIKQLLHRLFNNTK